MFKHRAFWMGALIAYGLAYFLPPSRILGRRKMG